MRDKTEMDADCFIDFFDMSCEAIMKRGKARPGDKTMLDALYPAIEAMKGRRKTSGDMRDIMDAAAEGAKAGAQNSVAAAAAAAQSCTERRFMCVFIDQFQAVKKKGGVAPAFSDRIAAIKLPAN